MYHPNCKDPTPQTYIEGITEPPTPNTKEEIKKNVENYNLEQVQRYNERQIRKYKRLEANSLDENNRKKYAVKVQEWQSKQRDLINAHPEQLRRDYSREKVRVLNITEPPKNATEITPIVQNGLTSNKDFSKNLDMFNFSNMPTNPTYTPQEIYDDLTLTKYGKEALEVIENLPQPIKLNYITYNPNVKGEEKGGVINIYMKSCKDLRTVACTIIHECTHYKYGIGNSQWAECVCIYQELLHRRKITFNRDYLTIAEKKTIIKAVKEAYPEFNWRKGGIINGKRRSR